MQVESSEAPTRFSILREAVCFLSPSKNKTLIVALQAFPEWLTKRSVQKRIPPKLLERILYFKAHWEEFNWRLKLQVDFRKTELVNANLSQDLAAINLQFDENCLTYLTYSGSSILWSSYSLLVIIYHVYAFNPVLKTKRLDNFALKAFDTIAGSLW